MPSKLEVNAAIGELLLTEPKSWGEALRTIVEFGHALPAQGSFSLSSRETVYRKIGPEDDSRLVPIPELTREAKFGVREEGAGNYQIWKQEDGMLFVRAPEVSPPDGEVPETGAVRTYLLLYEPDNLAVSGVVRVSYKNWFSLFGFRIQKIIALVVFGEGLGEERRIGFAYRRNR